MNEFIEKNKWLLQTYCVATQIIGWVLLSTAGIWAIIILLEYSRSSTPFITWLSIFIRILFGLVVLGVAQFIRYLFEAEYKPGWILRHGEKILYLSVALWVIRTPFLFFLDAKRMGDSVYYSPWGFLIVNGVPLVAGALIIFGLAQILRLILPVIEESKTLV